MVDLRKERRMRMIQEATELYLNGASIDDICEKFGKKRSAIYQWLRIGSGAEDYNKNKEYQQRFQKNKKKVIRTLGCMPNKGERTTTTAEDMLIDERLRKYK